MKKLLIVLLACAMMLSTAACHGGDSSSKTSSGAAASSGGTTSAGGGAVSGGANAGSAASGVTVSGAASKVPVVVKKSTYIVKTVKYEYKENNRNYRASYPQLSSDSVNCDAVNALLKNTALQTMNSLGTAKAADTVTVKVSDHVACQKDDFISVTFRETVDKSGESEKVSYLRSVNYDLKNQKAVSASDMVQKNSAMLTALQNAVKDQMSDKKAAKYPTAVLQSGMKNCSVYFKDDRMGISIPVSHELGDHEELIVDYDQTAGFRTGNAAWNYFIKK
ncbi:MAG: hypothetical protein LKJ17_02305 [Oscillospiraceae bacterium]|jgi:hypothetical protein|nr:hypothetical protein [Oscillospiraceae bacterium]